MTAIGEAFIEHTKYRFLGPSDQRREKMAKRGASKEKNTKGTREQLAHELMKMIQDIDVDGLIYLVEQANVLLYNQRVEQINKKIAGLKKKGREEIDGVGIEETKDGKNFFILIRNERVFFTLEEMRQIVRMCHAADDEEDASKRLYNWFYKNRKDLLVDCAVETSRDPHLANLYHKVITTYKPKEK